MTERTIRRRSAEQIIKKVDLTPELVRTLVDVQHLAVILDRRWSDKKRDTFFEGVNLSPDTMIRMMDDRFAVVCSEFWEDYKLKGVNILRESSHLAGLYMAIIGCTQTVVSRPNDSREAIQARQLLDFYKKRYESFCTTLHNSGCAFLGLVFALSDNIERMKVVDIEDQICRALARPNSFQAA